MAEIPEEVKIRPRRTIPMPPSQWVRLRQDNRPLGMIFTSRMTEAPVGVNLFFIILRAAAYQPWVHP